MCELGGFDDDKADVSALVLAAENGRDRRTMAPGCFITTELVHRTIRSFGTTVAAVSVASFEVLLSILNQ